MDQNFFDAQALRMLKAFFKIHDGDARELLIHLAESAGRGASIEGAVESLPVKLSANDGKVVAWPASRNPFK